MYTVLPGNAQSVRDHGEKVLRCCARKMGTAADKLPPQRLRYSSNCVDSTRHLTKMMRRVCQMHQRAEKRYPVVHLVASLSGYKR